MPLSEYPLFLQNTRFTVGKLQAAITLCGIHVFGLSMTCIIADNFVDCSATTWQFAASIMAIGLSWRESVAIVALGFFIISIVIALNGNPSAYHLLFFKPPANSISLGAIGAIYHTPFPVIARASWGFWGSYVAIISRAILAIFWFSIQTMNGANTVRVMIGAIWPSFLTLPNHIPEDQGITTNTMISFFIFWLIQIPFLCIHPNQLRWLFMVKSVIVPAAWIAILVWAFVSTPNAGDLLDQRATLTGSAYSWAWIASLTSIIGNFSTLSINQVSTPFPSLHKLIPILTTKTLSPISPATPKSPRNGK